MYGVPTYTVLPAAGVLSAGILRNCNIFVIIISAIILFIIIFSLIRLILKEKEK